MICAQVDRDLELTRNDVTPSRSGSWDRESRHEAEDDQGWPDSLGAAPGHEELAVQPGAEASPLFSPGGDTYVEDDNMSFAVRKSNICRRAVIPRLPR